ncbi:hypothetical protein E2C01_089673 [Portunus trituberculatus]|uniref:Uncharacterized protein n=1 Tax=Portunus trituberculatus TaxID=210409 RepID=A0A5B7JE69_PORTR|nr:hypothetical protein [Portunus trituberculatus]
MTGITVFPNTMNLHNSTLDGQDYLSYHRILLLPTISQNNPATNEAQRIHMTHETKTHSKAGTPRTTPQKAMPQG